MKYISREKQTAVLQLQYKIKVNIFFLIVIVDYGISYKLYFIDFSLSANLKSKTPPVILNCVSCETMLGDGFNGLLLCFKLNCLTILIKINEFYKLKKLF